jgi:two-component system, sensor histidine kinase ChiS
LERFLSLDVVMIKSAILTPLLVMLCGVFASSISRAQTSIDSLNQAVKESIGIEKANSLLFLAKHHLFIYPDSAIHYATEALKIAKEFKDIPIQAKANMAIGEAYQNLGLVKESVAANLRAIEIAETNNELTTLGSSYNALGINYYYLSDLPKAELYLQKAAAAKLVVDDFVFYSVIQVNLAGIYFYQQRYPDAIQLLKAAEKVLVENEMEIYLAPLYNALGANFEMQTQQFDSAEYYYQKVVEISTKYNDINTLATGFHNLGGINIRLKKYTTARQYLLKAEAVAESNKLENLRMGVYASMAELLDSMGDYKNALRYRAMQLELNKSLFEIDKQKAIDELEIKYDSAKKEREIQKQKEAINLAEIQAEKNRNKQNRILFILLIVLLLAVFTALYFWQRKRANQQLEKEKSRLFENIVHEIRTPLTLINGPLQLVKKEMNGRAELANHIHLIEQNSEKLVRLVNELLDASKLEKGKYVLNHQQGDLNDFVQNTLNAFESDAKNKNISIEFEPIAGASTFSFAGNALEKIISNLVSNAIKYSAVQSIIAVRLSVVESMLTIEVSDNGPGIPQKEQQRIFERFYRMKNHDSFSGTGIGLSLVKELVDLQQGQISLESAEGKGTTFKISIPVQQVDSSYVELSEDDLKPMLLLVEDDADITSFVSGIFKERFRIISAKNGQQGIESIATYLPDIVLTDIMMPVKDGIELLQEVKTNSLTNHIPVVVFSARSSIESRLEGLKHGADAYISKPFNPDELQLLIQNLYSTIQRNQQDFQAKLKTELDFEKRIKSTNDFANEAIGFIVENIENTDYSVNELAADLCLSRSQLHRKLTSLTGFSATNFIRMVRLEKAKDLLKSHAGNVTEIAYACGFSSQSYFTKSFTEYFGQSPSKLF